MRKIYPLLLLLGLTSAAKAQPQKEEKAFAILDNLIQYNSFQAAFIYSNQAPSNDAEEALEGEIVVQGSKYRLKLGTQEVVNNGETIWTYLADDKEVQVATYDPAQEAAMPWHIFTNYRQDYKLLSMDDEQINKSICDRITLTAKDKEHPLPKVVLTVERATKNIKQLAVLDSNQTLHTFCILEFNTGRTFDKSFFDFNLEEHGELEVIDMR